MRARSTKWAVCTRKKATWTAQQSCLSSRPTSQRCTNLSMLHTANCSCGVQEVEGERSQSYGGSLNSTAYVLYKKGDHSRALCMLQQACGIFEVPYDCPQVLLC